MSRAGLRPRLDALRHRMRLEARDALELVLLPGLAAVLPWRWCFAVFRRLAHWPWLYRRGCEAALQGAMRRGMVQGDAAQWLWRRRLVTLVDHADLYLSRTRSDAWMDRWLDVQGAWPEPQRAGVLCTFHWGAGMWGLRHAARSGLRVHSLVGVAPPRFFAGRAVLGWYARQRPQEMTRVSGPQVVPVTESLRTVVRALRQNEQVMGVVDVPADQVAASEAVVLRGMAARVPRGLLRLAQQQGVPVTFYITGLDVQTGRRFLRMASVPLPQGRGDEAVGQLIGRTFAHLDALLHEDTAAWHFWGEADRFFRP